MAAADQPKKSSKMVWRTCMLCSTRLSELCYDTHTKCEVCRGQVCSSDSFCVECEGWSADLRKLYLRHKHSLFTKRVSKKNRKEGKSKSKSPRADAPPPPPSDDAASTASQESHVTSPVIYMPLNLLSVTNGISRFTAVYTKLRSTAITVLLTLIAFKSSSVAGIIVYKRFTPIENEGTPPDNTPSTEK